MNDGYLVNGGCCKGRPQKKSKIQDIVPFHSTPTIKREIFILPSLLIKIVTFLKKEIGFHAQF